MDLLQVFIQTKVDYLHKKEKLDARIMLMTMLHLANEEELMLTNDGLEYFV